MFRTMLAVFFIIGAFFWFWDIVELITGKYELNPWSVGVSAFITGMWLIESAFKLVQEKK